jgi:hypothetical protein
MHFILSESRLRVHYLRVEQPVTAVRFGEIIAVLSENHVRYRQHIMRKTAEFLTDTHTGY